VLFNETKVNPPFSSNNKEETAAMAEEEDEEGTVEIAVDRTNNRLSLWKLRPHSSLVLSLLSLLLLLPLPLSNSGMDQLPLPSPFLLLPLGCIPFSTNPFLWHDNLA
jgi:hypothetical protein